MIFRLSQGGICLNILIPWRAITFCLGNCTSWDSPAAMSPFKSGLLFSKWILKSRTNKLCTIDRGYLSLAPPQPSSQKKIQKKQTPSLLPCKVELNTFEWPRLVKTPGGDLWSQCPPLDVPMQKLDCLPPGWKTTNQKTKPVTYGQPMAIFFRDSLAKS